MSLKYIYFLILIVLIDANQTTNYDENQTQNDTQLNVLNKEILVKNASKHQKPIMKEIVENLSPQMILTYESLIEVNSTNITNKPTSTNDSLEEILSRARQIDPKLDIFIHKQIELHQNDNKLKQDYINNLKLFIADSFHIRLNTTTEKINSESEFIQFLNDTVNLYDSLKESLKEMVIGKLSEMKENLREALAQFDNIHPKSLSDIMNDYFFAYNNAKRNIYNVFLNKSKGKDDDYLVEYEENIIKYRKAQILIKLSLINLFFNLHDSNKGLYENTKHKFKVEIPIYLQDFHDAKVTEEYKIWSSNFYNDHKDWGISFEEFNQIVEYIWFYAVQEFRNRLYDEEVREVGLNNLLYT